MEETNNFDFTESRKYKLSLAIICSLFLYLFLVFFQPFGVNNYEPSSFLSPDLLIGLIAIVPVLFLTIYLNELFLRPRLVKVSFLKQLILWFIWEFYLVGTSSFLLYNFLGNFHDFYLPSYFKHIIEVSSVLIFPYFGTFFFFRFNKIKKDFEEVLSVSNEISNLNEIVLISGEYKKDQIALQINKIIVIESEDNYAGLNYLEENKIKKYLIRSTLTNIEKILTSELIVRCNRSYIVNLNQLESYKIVSNKLFLKLNHFKEEVLVSKTNYKNVMNLIEKHVLNNMSDSVHP